MEINQCWVCAEGHLSDDVFLTQNINNFGNCLWEVYVQCQYTAIKEFHEAQEAIRNFDMNDPDIIKRFGSKEVLDRLNQLHRSALSEQSLNKNLMSMKAGKSVTFGDVIQLRHLKSRKFLTVSAYQLAKQERENVRVVNEPEGSSLSAMTFVPKSRTDKEGSIVKSGSEFSIRIHEKSGEFLRAVKKAALIERFEVNCSPELNYWKMFIFQPKYDLRSKLITSDVMVTLFDSDSSSHLAVVRPSCSTENYRVVASPSAARNPEYQSLYVGTEYLWCVEKDDLMEGGMIQLSKQVVTFRHLNTNRYLKLDTDGTLIAVREKQPGSRFEVHSMRLESAMDQFLVEGSAFCISTVGQKQWLCINGTKILDEEQCLSTLCESTGSRLSALRLVPSKSIFSKLEADLCFGLSAAAKMQSFVQFMRQRLPQGKGAMLIPNSDTYTQAAVHVRSILALADTTCMFLGEQKEVARGAGNEDKSGLALFLDLETAEKVEADKVLVRQCMMLEQGVIEALLDILDMCAQGLFDNIKLTGAAKESSAKVSVSPPTRQLSKGASVRGIVKKDSSVSNRSGSTIGGSFSLENMGMVPQNNTSVRKVSDSGGSKSTKSATTSRKDSKGESSSVKSAIQMMGMSFRTNPGPYKVPADDDDQDASNSDSDNDAENSGDDGSCENAPRGVPPVLKHIASPETTSKKISSSPSAKSSVSSLQSLAQRRSSNALMATARRGSSVSRIQQQMENLASRPAFDEKSRGLTVSQDIAHALLRILLLCSKNNHLTQLHISTRLKSILDHVTTQYLAVKTLRELLKDNLRILHSKIAQADIDLMLSHLRQHEMNVTFLKLLQSTCSCPRGVDSTQRMVVLSLFGESSKKSASLTVNISMDDSWATKVHWTSGSNYHYIPDPSSSGFEEVNRYIMGFRLLRNGLPKVYINWAHGSSAGSDPRISMAQLFGARDSIPIEKLSVFVARRPSEIDLMSQQSLSQRRSSSTKRNSSVLHNRGGKQRKSVGGAYQINPVSKASSPEELKCQVADYLVAQMYLVADLCLDRNYVSVRILEKIYKYDLLITLLKMDELSNTFKAPVCKIIRTLWVDREPHVATVFPNLIRSTKKSEILCNSAQGIANSKVDDDAVPQLSHYSFRIVQQIISDYLWHKLAESKRDEYSYEILELLQALMRFGFYSSDKEQLQDIIIPIVKILDRTKHAIAAVGLTDSPVNLVTKSANVSIDSWSQNITHKANYGVTFVYNCCSSITIENLKYYWEVRREKRIQRANSSATTTGFGSKLGGTSRSSQKYSSVKQRSGANHSGAGLADEFWEEKLISFLDSITGMIFTLSVVLITCSLSISQFFADDNDTPLVKFYEAFDIAITVYFTLELIIRIYCMLIIHSDPTMFFQNIFNALDFALVALDLVLVGLGTDNSVIGAARVTRAARVLRLLRLLRILRALRLLKKIADANRLANLWSMPSRYSSLTELDVKSIVSMLRIMTIVYSKIQDQQLDLICNSFDDWSESHAEGLLLQPVEAYRKALARVDQYADLPPEFDAILLDMLMHSDSKITREALQLLVMHKSSRHILFEVLQDVKIVYSPKVKQKLEQLQKIMRDVQRMTEMYEIWQDFATEEDIETADDMLASIQTLDAFMKKLNENPSLTIESHFIPDEECQQIARNLHAMDCIMGLFHTLWNGGRSSLDPRIVKILRLASSFIRSFVVDNERNQLDAFPHLNWFVERIDDGLDAHIVIQSILLGNNHLIGECNTSYISIFAQKILTVGRRFEYLSIFLGLCQLHPRETLLHSLRPMTVLKEISRFITGKEWKNHILYWFCSPNTEEFAQRSAAMDEYKYLEYPPLQSELSPELRYYVDLLDVVKYSFFGPRLHVLFSLDDILLAILEPNCLLVVKIALGGLALQIIDAGVDNIDMAENVWRFFEDAVVYLDSAMTSIKSICTMPQGELSSMMRIQMRQWIEIILDCTVAFFNFLDLNTFGELLEGEVTIVITQRTEQEVVKVIKNLYQSIRQFMDCHGMLIGKELTEKCGHTLLSLVSQCSTLNYSLTELHVHMEMFNSHDSKPIRSTISDMQQVAMRKQFLNYANSIRQAEMPSIYDESVAMLNKVPMMNDPKHSDVRFEVLLEKISLHINNMLSNGELNGRKSQVAEQAIWVFRSYRATLECELTYDKNSQDTLAERILVSETARAEHLRAAYMNNGLVKLAIECCAPGINSEVSTEAIYLLVEVLSKRGGNEDAQRHIQEILDSKESAYFFKFADMMLVNLMNWCKKENEVGALVDSEEVDEEDEEELQVDVVLPSQVLILELLQMLCEGDYHPLKSLMQAQERNSEQVNLISRLAVIIDMLSRMEAPVFTSICLYMFRAVRKIIYGLNKRNQEYLVLGTEVLPSMNRLMRSSRARTTQLSTAWYNDMERLKEIMIDVLLCSMEGHSVKSAICDRIVNVMELKVLTAVLTPNLSDTEASDNTQYSDNNLTVIETKYLQLLETLGKSEEVLTDIGVHNTKENIMMVEVVRNYKVHTIYFQKPAVVEHLSDEFVQKIAENLDCSSQESKLLDFMRKIKLQYIETNYQALLKPYGLAQLWAWRERLQWVMFINATIMNCLILTYFTKEANFNIEEGEITSVLETLTVIQISMASLLAFLFCFIRLPASYVSLLENGRTVVQAIVETASDITLIWRLGYVIICVIGLGFNYIFLTFLMLDWVLLDSSTRQVLKAVQYPFRQLVATMIIIIIALNIFAGAYFVLFHHDSDFELDTMFDALKLGLSYGVRGEYGMGHEFHHTLGPRLVLDVAFYFIVLAILRNSFMAIIVDTFGKLREVQYERDLQASNSCFICGVERYDYDKLVNPGAASSFGLHRSVTHRIENYIFFVLSVWSQPQKEDNGLQMYVRKRIAANDVGWFPIGIITKTLVENEKDEANLAISSATANNAAAMNFDAQEDEETPDSGSSPLRTSSRQEGGLGGTPEYAEDSVGGMDKLSIDSPKVRDSPVMGRNRKTLLSSAASSAESKNMEDLARSIRSSFDAFSRRLDALEERTAQSNLSLPARDLTYSQSSRVKELVSGSTTASLTLTTSGDTSAQPAPIDTRAPVADNSGSMSDDSNFHVIRPSPLRANVRPWGSSPYSTLDRIRTITSSQESVVGPSIEHAAVASSSSVRPVYESSFTDSKEPFE